MTPPAESSRIVRERHFEAPDLGALNLLLRRERFTGTVTLHFSLGGICAAHVTEEQKLTFDANPLDSVASGVIHSHS